MRLVVCIKKHDPTTCYYKKLTSNIMIQALKVEGWKKNIITIEQSKKKQEWLWQYHREVDFRAKHSEIKKVTYN